MNPRPDSSTDELMWLLAESGEPGALESFVKKHPEYRRELYQRVAMLKTLKGSSPAETSTRASDLPKFELREVSASPTIIPRWAWASAASVALFAIGYGSFRATQNVTEPKIGPIASRETGANPQTTEFGGGVRTAPAPDGTNPNQNAAVEPIRPIAEVDPIDRPITLRFAQASIIEVLNTISRIGGIKIELAPDMPNFEISVDYQEVSVRKILDGIGQTAGFTALVQSPSSVLIIPAVDPNRKPLPDGPEAGQTKVVDQGPSPMKPGKDIEPTPMTGESQPKSTSD